MENILITEDILLKNGFERLNLKDDEVKVHNNIWGIEDYRAYVLWTNDEQSIKIDMRWKCTNNGANWYMHIDNCDCETIGSADIDYIEQFNLMMKVFNSNFNLTI